MIPSKYKLSLDRFHKEVGALIKKHRTMKNVSQEKLALGVGMTRTSINNMEHGRQRIILDTLLMISDILNVQMVDLLPKNFEISPSLNKQFPKGTPKELKDWVLTEVIEN